MIASSRPITKSSADRWLRVSAPDSSAREPITPRPSFPATGAAARDIVASLEISNASSPSMESLTIAGGSDHAEESWLEIRAATVNGVATAASTPEPAPTTVRPIRPPLLAMVSWMSSRSGVSP